ncbi:MAG: response regulator [bacterium]|nr:response regulator [bacterium]
MAIMDADIIACGQQQPDSPPSILLVDDELNVLRSLQRLFMEENYRLHLAENAQEGLAILEQEPVHLVIADYRMPGMDGVSFLKEVRQRYPQIVRIILSGFADPKSMVAAINEGEIYKFIPKPWNDDHLKAMVSSAIDRYRLVEENRRLTEIVRKQNRELRELTEELEQMVINRTADLLAQNRILSLSQRIIDSLPIPVIALNSQRIITVANDQAQRLLGSNLINRRDKDILPKPIMRIIQDVREVGIRQQECRGSLFHNFTGRVVAIRFSTIEPSDGVILVLFPEGDA